MRILFSSKTTNCSKIVLSFYVHQVPVIPNSFDKFRMHAEQKLRSQEVK